MLPSWTAWSFAAAGALCALGPVIIHLLNRRRFRTVQWAAMDFLREALQRNRRILQLRDIILLALRTAAVLLFGLALARPYWTSSSEKFDASQPLHAALLVDNSLSMNYETLGVTSLDRAKERAKPFIDRLPSGSRISVIPLCGTPGGLRPDPYRTKEDALDALARIQVVDRSSDFSLVANAARRAGQTVPEMATRVVLFGDQQLRNWRGYSGAEDFQQLPGIQVVDVSPENPAVEMENAWIASFRVQDGIADLETPATFIVQVRYQGPTARENVPVSLEVDGVAVATKTINLEPGTGGREVTFHYTFDSVAPEPGRPTFVPARVSIPADRLAADDERYLAVPVVAALPVVFVDQFGQLGEDPVKGKYGETRHLRRLLAPVTRRGETGRQLVQIRHVGVDDLSRDLLEDVRLVVVAGVPDPGDAVGLLREFVQQGGQLVIAAGGNFDPDAWTSSAWLDGNGILPAPLQPEFVGSLPEDTPGELRPFFLAYPSMKNHALFRLAGTSDEELADLYAEPFFFKAVDSDLGLDTQRALLVAEQKRLEKEFRLLAEASAEEEKWAKLEADGKLGPAEQAARRDMQRRVEEIRPRWVLWSNQSAADQPQLDEAGGSEPDRQRKLERLARRTLPRVLAAFDNGTAYFVERQIGQGRMLFVSSGLFSGWNTLPKTNVMLTFDRMLRGMLRSTLPDRNVEPAEQLTLPVEQDDPGVALSLKRPGDDAAEILELGFLSAETRGVTIQDALERGIYRVSARRAAVSAQDEGLDAKLWEIPLAVNGKTAAAGSGSESELALLTRAQFEQRVGEAPLRWIGPDETISLAGAQVRGQNWWWYLILAVLVLLLIELAILAWPSIRERLALT